VVVDFGFGCFGGPADIELERAVLEQRVVARVSLRSRFWRFGRSVRVVWRGTELWLVQL